MSVLGSAGKGAAIGSVAGPIGTVVGGAIGGIGSWLSGNNDQDEDDRQQAIWNGEENNRKANDFSWGGDSGQRPNPKFDPNRVADDSNPQYIQGPSAADRDAARYQGMGASWANMQAPHTNYDRADASRGMQINALSQMQDAAYGNTPSQAAILMRQGNDQAMANSLAMAAGARGPAAMAGAQQQAMGNNSAMATNNQNNIGALRAQEMAQARGAYMQGASGMRGQDQSQAQYGSDLEMRQRGLGLQGQEAYEHMGFNTKQAQMGGKMAMRGADEAHWKSQMDADQHSTDRDVNTALEAGKIAASTLGEVAGAASDVRVKQDVHYEGVDPLSRLRGRY